MTTKAEYGHGRGEHSPSSDEKVVGGVYDPTEPYDLPPDPDAGKSAEERAAMVRPTFPIKLTDLLLTVTPGQEARPSPRF
jgi:hypothetical protein